MNQRALHFYEFGPFRLNATERLLQRGSELVPLTPKVFDTLLVLVENNGHVLEKNELMEQLWPDSFVEESSLTQNISLLRRALIEVGNEGNYIETIPKRGYRFNAVVHERDELSNGHAIAPVDPVHLSENGSASTEVAPLATASETDNKIPSRRRANLYQVTVACAIALGVLVAVVYGFRNRARPAGFAPKSIAVLPFKTIGTNGETDLIGLGMADALIIKLSKLDELTVLPTSSIHRFTKRERDPVEVGRELGVEAVLDGTVQRDGDLVRVTAQLIRLADGKTVWSGKFDERYSSIFSLQDSISEQLSVSLRPQVAQNELRKNKKTHATENTEAYQAYLTGLYFWNRRTRENLPKAIEHLERAVALDPNFAEPWAILADSHLISTNHEFGSANPEEAHKRAYIAVNRALELDDSSAEAHTAKAGLTIANRNYEEAVREYQRALELNPNYAVAHVRYAYLLYWSFRLDDAVYHMKRAQQLDPVSAITNGAYAGMLYNARDYDGCITYAKRALELEPESIGARLNLGEAYIQKRMFVEAHETFDRLRQSALEYKLWEKAYTYAFAGRHEDAKRMLAEIEKLDSDNPREYFNYSLVYGAMGEKDKAFEEMAKINFGPLMKAAMKYDPQFDPLRGDPRFKEFLKRNGIE